jgi:hypothetical protein
MRRALGAGLLAVTACGGGGIALPRPTGFEPGTPEAMAAWARSTAPETTREIRFRWQIRDDRGAAGGRGRVRYAPPDSARLDVAGPLGSGRAAAFVSGDTAIWAQPEEDVRRLVPSYPLFWGLLGVARPAPTDARVRRFQDESILAWQYQAGADTVDYVRVAGPPVRLLVEVRQRGEVVGTVETRLDPEGRPTSARLVVPSVPARLDLTFNSNTEVERLAPDTWTPPQP